MKILLINSVCGIGSTGRICTDLAREFEDQGHEVKIAYGRQDAPERFQKYGVQIGGKVDLIIHALQTRFFDTHGFGSVAVTKNFLQWAEEYDPDLLWLHNLHGYYINIELLFDWIKSRPHMQVKWSLHDCWAFTGHCSHFTYVGCDQWRTGCKKCSQSYRYPASLFDNCRKNYLRKKAAFTGVKNMTLITTSQWLTDLVKVSFLGEYPVQLQYNKIDTNVFKPTPSDFRQKYKLDNKKIVLAVASVWEERKGFYDILRLGKMLDDRYVLVMVGLSDKQRQQMPKTLDALAKNPDKWKMAGDVRGEIIYGADGCVAVPTDVNALYREITGEEYVADAIKKPAAIFFLGRTNSPRELAEIYTAADVFANATYEDTYPTVNLEARACGLRVVTYNVCGTPETIL